MLQERVNYASKLNGNRQEKIGMTEYQSNSLRNNRFCLTVNLTKKNRKTSTKSHEKFIYISQ